MFASSSPLPPERARVRARPRRHVVSARRTLEIVARQGVRAKVAGEGGLQPSRFRGRMAVWSYTMSEVDPNRTIRIAKLADQGKETDLADTTPAQRFEMMWQLALDAWAMMGEPVTDPRLPRHIVRVFRRERS